VPGLILDVVCPTCLAKPGEPCCSRSGELRLSKYSAGYHRTRERSFRHLQRQLELPFADTDPAPPGFGWPHRGDS
jgi:hypothetical protein